MLNNQIPKLQEMMDNSELSIENIDVFCEKGVFSVDETRRILMAGKEAGMALNFHGDELHPMKAAEVEQYCFVHALEQGEGGGGGGAWGIGPRY